MSVPVIIKFGKKEQEILLIQKGVIIGRSSKCDITIIDSLTSGNHTQIFLDKNDYFHYQDLNSTNGTYLNGSKIS